MRATGKAGEEKCIDNLKIIIVNPLVGNMIER